MKKLSEHNKTKKHRAYSTSRGVGVVCDVCGIELVSSGARFMSNPPKSAVHCPNEDCKDYLIQKPMKW